MEGKGDGCYISHVHASLRRDVSVWDYSENILIMLLNFSLILGIPVSNWHLIISAII